MLLENDDNPTNESPRIWDHGHKLVARTRALEADQKDYFYSVNKYVRLAHEEYKKLVLEVDESPSMRGNWRKELGLSAESSLDLEIGTGNGYFFEHHARNNKNRGLIGIELKYKCLIQTVRRTLFTGHPSFRMLRYDAKFINALFAVSELNDVFVFFPDPWDKRKENKHRLIDSAFLSSLFAIQRPGSKLEIKTDSESYFKWICERAPNSPYKIEAMESDLHNSPWASQNFATHFERLWTRKGRKTHYLRLIRI